MKKLTMMLIALALCLCAVMPVTALDDPKVPGFTNQYVEVKNDVSTTGQFFGHIRAGTNVFSNEVVVIGPTGQFTVPVNSDGTFEVTNTTPGKYAVYLLDGNGGQYEQSSFTIGAGQTSQLDSEILGHAYSAGDGKQPDVIVVTIATYGMTKEVCEEIEAYYTVERASSHWEGWGWNRHLVYDGNCDKVNHGHHANFYVNGQGYSFANHGEYQYTYHEAEENCETVGEYIDVTQQVQSVIDQGARSFFFFDNAQNHGGIFGMGNQLLAQIDDPAPGQVKKVHIEYSVNGDIRTIDTDEYKVITI